MSSASSDDSWGASQKSLSGTSMAPALENHRRKCARIVEPRERAAASGAPSAGRGILSAPGRARRRRPRRAETSKEPARRASSDLPARAYVRRRAQKHVAAARKPKKCCGISARREKPAGGISANRHRRACRAALGRWRRRAAGIIIASTRLARISPLSKKQWHRASRPCAEKPCQARRPKCAMKLHRRLMVRAASALRAASRAQGGDDEAGLLLLS